MKAVLAHRRVRLTVPHGAAHGTVRERDLVTLTVADHDGVVGRGEAAPLPSYDGVTLERVLAALRVYVPVLEAAATVTGEPRTPTGAQAVPLLPGAELLEACRRADPLPQALAAVDLALWDLAGRRAGAPVAALLHPAPAARGRLQRDDRRARPRGARLRRPPGRCRMASAA